MLFLGISAFYHDSAAAIVRDGEIVAAAQEERFTRRKHDAGFPLNAIEYCLREAGESLDSIDRIAFYDKPLLKFERLLETYLAFAPRGFKSFSMAIPLWLREKLFLKDLLVRRLKRVGAGEDIEQRLMFSEHHLSHAASAYFPSPFKEAAVLTMDGVGEWATTSLAVFGVYLLHGFQGQLRRIQGNGACSLWRAQICATHLRQLDRLKAGWLIQERPGYDAAQKLCDGVRP
jgi:carbamoyltransferase